MKKGVIIQASARSNGNTSKVVSYASSMVDFEVIDLATKEISHFDYQFNNNEDDFNFLFKGIVQKYDIIVFATPVYWYTMSGLMKVFLDRISDFLFKEKEFGRMLRGKDMAVISCSNGNDRPEEFNLPFVLSAEYLGMNYTGDVHTWLENDQLTQEAKERINAFILKLKSSK